MRRTLGIVGLGLAAAVTATAAAAQVDEGVWWDDDGLSYFHTAVNDYYDVPVHSPPPSSYLHPDELPVVYLLAREARVSPEVVIALREQGWSWMDITYHLGVDPYVYVSRLPRQSGYWGWRGGRDYRYLTDRHIIDYVNLFFWADYYRRPVTQVIVIRQRVPTWFYYVRYHAPPRVVYIRNPVRWAYAPPVRRGDSGRRSEPIRRAEPRSGTAPQGTRTATRPTPSTRATQPTRAERSAPATRATSQPSRPATPTARPTQPSRPAEARRPAESSRPAAQPTRPAQGSRPAAQPTRPAPSSRPAAQPSQPAQGSRPAAQPSRPAQSSRPAAQRPSSSSRESARSSGASAGSSRATTSTRRPSRPGG